MSDPRALAAGELIVLIDKAGRRHRVRLKAGERHSLHSGVIAHDELIGRPEGIVVTTQMGARLLAVRPTIAEQVTGRVRWRESPGRRVCALVPSMRLLGRSTWWNRSDCCAAASKGIACHR